MFCRILSILSMSNIYFFNRKPNITREIKRKPIVNMVWKLYDMM